MKNKLVFLFLFNLCKSFASKKEVKNININNNIQSPIQFQKNWNYNCNYINVIINDSIFNVYDTLTIVPYNLNFGLLQGAFLNKLDIPQNPAIIDSQFQIGIGTGGLPISEAKLITQSITLNGVRRFIFSFNTGLALEQSVNAKIVGKKYCFDISQFISESDSIVYLKTINKEIKEIKLKINK